MEILRRIAKASEAAAREIERQSRQRAIQYESVSFAHPLPVRAHAATAVSYDMGNKPKPVDAPLVYRIQIAAFNRLTNPEWNRKAWRVGWRA